jgi:starch phosphorylase
MKFALNGGLIIGTLDGANIEIRDNIGKENMFVFGLTADKVSGVAKHYWQLRVDFGPRWQMPGHRMPQNIKLKILV